jgi:hypothetical protein
VKKKQTVVRLLRAIAPIGAIALRRVKRGRALIQ